MSILVLNAGSSTLKFALFDDDAAADDAAENDAAEDDAADELCSGLVDWQGQQPLATVTLRTPTADTVQSHSELTGYEDAVACILRTLIENGFADPVQAVGHRVVHGGNEFRDSVVIDDEVTGSLEKIAGLAPLHLPPVLKTLNATRMALPNVPEVAVFDTTFFSDLPERAVVYPVPYHWREEYGIRRFGFHGISHEYCAGRAAELLGRKNDRTLRLIVCHLGNGASATAVLGGRAIATTMGFTPMEGLMMGTRCGSIDPGILLYLMQQHDFDAGQLEEMLNRQSGLLGVSGISRDFREIEQAADSGNQRTRLAIDMFADRIRSAIGSLAVTLGGVDGLIFTAGIGENSPVLRSLVCDGLQCVGLQLDPGRNAASFADCDVAAPESTGRILVIHTREEQMVARETKRLIGSSSLNR